MAKDYAKFIPPKKRPQSKSKGSAYFFIFLSVLVLLGAGGGYFFYAKQPALFSKGFALLTHKKIPPAVKPVVKPLAQASAPEVQFDFYSELPNMQVTFSEPGVVTKGLTQIKEPTAAKTADSKDPELKTAGIRAEDIDELPELNAPAPATSSAAKQPDIFNTNALKSLLDAESQTAGSQYVIQLGVFESLEAAQRLLAAINAVGFEGNVIKSPNGYRVQQGPYGSKELAKLTQQRMQKRGIISIIRKTA
jgi:cell division protein FtsN